MMGHRRNLCGNYDVISMKRYYGHKAGGAVAFVKKRVRRQERLLDKTDIRERLRTD